MNAYDTLPDGVTDVFGEQATAARAYDLLTVDVPADTWIAALRTARSELGCTYFDWLSAVDEPGTGFQICAHVVALGEGTGAGRVRRLLLRTTVPHAAPVLASAIDVYAGAAWHERETHEMFGVEFTGHPHLVPLLLPENFEGHPLRKDFVLAARVAKAWPGAKEPGESEHGGPKRRQMLPPGVPDPNEWGPLKGQLPPAAARPARTPRAAGADRPARAAGERPVRRARSVSDGSASQTAEGAPATPGAESTPGASATPSAESPSSTSGAQVTPGTETTPGASAPATPGAPSAPASPEIPATPEAPAAPAVRPRRARSASEGSASQAASGAGDGPASSQGTDARRRPAGPSSARSADAPWHHAKPAFDEPEPTPAPEAAPAEEPTPAPDAADPDGKPAPAPGTDVPEPSDPAEPDREPAAKPDREPAAKPDREPAAKPDREPSAKPDREPAAKPDPTDPAGGDPRE
ncbi:NADH-quinone oxidoreductase subunit C [Streptomyces sp. NPDC048361]|uniref:NADH-quinone oxidoreductase subunit C n=1 Tax=Streptomyces sp. NPDC048361 TaxID=3154720 RepID=UPI00341CDAEE